MLTSVTIVPGKQLEQLELFEVAPDVMVAAKPRTMAAPRIGLVTWQPKGDGTFVPQVETHPAIVNLKKWDEKIYGVSKDTIAALVDAGFVDGERPAPRTMLISLESWFKHRERTRGPNSFWLDDGHRARFSEALSRRHCGRKEAKKRRAGKDALETASDASPPDSAPLTLFKPGDARKATANRGEKRRRAPRIPAAVTV